MVSMTVTEAKAHLLEIIRKADESMQHFVISKNGKPKAIIMSIDEYEGWLETLEILSDKSAVADIKEARKELKNKEVYTFDEVFNKAAKKEKKK